MSYTNVWSDSLPTGSEAANTIATLLRQSKVDVEQRFGDIFAIPDFTVDPLRPYGLKFTDVQDAKLYFGDNAGTPRKILLRDKADTTTYVTLASTGITAPLFTGPVTGVINTAAQPNITSLGTLTGLTVSLAQNTFTDLILSNTTVGTIATSRFKLVNDHSIATYQLQSSGFTTSGIGVADGALLYNNGSGGINIVADNIAGVIKFYTGSQVLAATISAAQLFTLTGGLLTPNQISSTLSGGDIGSAFFASAAAPAFGWRTTGAALNEKVWDIVSVDNTLNFRTALDAGAGNVNWLTVTRSGTTPTSIVTSGIFAVGTTVTTGAAAGDIVLSRGGALRSVTTAGTGTQLMIYMDSSGIVQLGDNASGGPIAVPRITAAAYASATILKGIFYTASDTAGTLVFFDGVTGARYKLTGTAF